MAYIEMATSRDGYGPDQIRRTITLGEMIEVLQELAEECGEDALVYTTHDNCYTFGAIGDRDFRIKGLYFVVANEDGEVCYSGLKDDCDEFLAAHPDMIEAGYRVVEDEDC